MLLPVTIANFSQNQGGTGILATITTYLGHGRPLYMVAYVGLIVFFAFFYTAIVFNPVETADNLKKHGGFVPGIRPGERTAQYIDTILTRITAIGAAYLALDLSSAGNADLLCGAAVLFRRNLSPHRGQRHHGYGGSDHGPSAGASV